MSKRPAKKYWSSLVKTVFPKLDLGSSQDPRAYVGHTIKASREMSGSLEDVVIETIQGNITYPKYFEINGKYFCHMYSFYIQVLEGRLPEKSEMDEFELASEITNIKAIKDK